ncbi:MAG: exodeoxyribonuclease V subunit alpha [Chlorobiaceae bacterium]
MTIEFHERAIDRHFAEFIGRQSSGEVSEIFLLVVSLASSAIGRGNLCLNLADIAGHTVRVNGKELLLPQLDALLELVRSASVVTVPGKHHRPLVLDAAGRLYLYRYWRYEHELAEIILQKAAAVTDDIADVKLHKSIERLFPESADHRQKGAAMVVLQRLFCVISGGPGTGKTSTVVRILALLLEQDGGRKQRIAMATPTGKAAARLKQSVNDIRHTLNCSDEVKSAIPDNVVTIQRLLGSISGSTRFRHSARNPLPFDTVIIDEASMVALPLMSALVAALKPTARLILLGDKDQLASVEAGAVLGDIYSAGQENPASPLFSVQVVLEKNYRFQPGSGIAEISRAVNAGQEREALELLQGNEAGTILWQSSPDPEELRTALASTVTEGYQSYLEATSPDEALERFDRFRILCALRDGPYGVSGLNNSIERILARQGLITQLSIFYRGRPILVTVNDYAMRLFNGDTGILFPDPDNGGLLKAFFPNPEGGVRSIPPERLPAHETAYAMTIHKSQGSEFDCVIMLLPPVDSELLTRELIYTGMTRAKKAIELWANKEVFCSAVSRKTERNSGLRDALRWK